jgi:hypothetical protein
MKKNYIFLLIVLMSFFGCIKKDDLKIQNLSISGWKPDWAIPVTNTTLTLKNVVQHAYTGNTLTVDSTGLYSIHYDGRILSANASDYIKIPDQNFNTNGVGLSSPINMSSYTGSIADSFGNHYTYTDTAGAELNHLKIKSGNLGIQVYSSYQQNLSAQVVFPTVKNGSTPLSINVSINYPNHNYTQQINLSNYVFDFTNNNTTYNYLPYYIKYTITGTGQPIYTTDTIGATINLTNLQFAFADGYLGHYTIPMNTDTIPIEIFNNTINANIFLENPIIKLSVDNSFGLSATGNFSTFEGITKQGVINNIGGAFFSNPITVNGPTVVGTTTTNNYQIDKTNSNVQNVFNPAPNKVVFAGNISIGKGSPTYNFVTDTSKLIVNAEAILPAWFKIIDFQLQDTVKLSLPRDTNILQKISFKILCENHFGLYANVQMYFCDSTYKILDSLIAPPNSTLIINQAPVNSIGVVTQSKTQESVFDIDQTRYQKLASRVRYGLVRGNLKTSSTISIQIHSLDYLRVQLAARLVLNINNISK